MSTYRSRPLSPPRHRDAHRTSTGNIYGKSYDTLSSSQSSRSTANSISSHTSTSTPYEIQPIRKTILPEGKKTEYVVRPRHNSLSSQETRKPLTIATTRNLSPSRRGTLISPREVVSAGLPREDGKRYLQPASSLAHRQLASHHQRHHSSSRAEPDGYDAYSGRKERQYSFRGSEGPRQYYVGRSQAPRPAGEDDWTYTTPSEQFGRDFPNGLPQDKPDRRERALSAYESDREISSRRNHGPPLSGSRQLARIEKAEADRRPSRSSFDSDSDRASDRARRHYPSKAPTVLHQQHHRDEGYSSARDDYESRGHLRLNHDRHDDRHVQRSRRGSNNHRDAESKTHRRKYEQDDGGYERDQERDRERDRERDHDRDRGDKVEHRRKPRSRDLSPEKPSLKELAVGAFGGLATAGTIGTLLGRDNKERSGESEDDRKPNRRHRHHRREHEGGSDESDERRRSHKRDEPSGENTGIAPERRRQSSRRRYYDDHEDNDDAGESRRDLEPPSSARRRPTQTEPERQPRGSVAPHISSEDSQALATRTISPGENEDDRPRKVMLVEPEKKEESKPRGILKPSRQTPFPEDPNPVREGVAPLKDSTKDGIPPNARWTKISRVLVNPEALERASERFEEREEYVVVLRVLSREEITRLAERTTQIRQARLRDWEREYNDKNRRNKTDDAVGDEDADEGDKPRLAIEAPPAASLNDLRNLTKPSQSQHSLPPAAAAAATRAASTDSYLDAANVTQNYSQNV